MKRHRCMLLLGAVFIGVLTLAALGFRFFGHYALRAYIAQLRAKGEKVTMSELAASLTPGVCNSASVLSNVMLKLGPPPSNPTNLSLMHFVSLGRAQVAWRQPAPPWTATTENIATNWDLLTQRVRQAEAPLAELRLAMKQPAPNAGPRTNIFFQTGVHYTVVRAATFWLTSAALAGLHDHHPGEALANLQAVAGLANLYHEDYTLQNAMVRAAVAGKGLDLTWEALQEPAWNDEQLLALQRSWESVDLLAGLERGFEGERIFVFESLDWWLSQQSKSGQTSSTSQLGKRLWRETVVANDLQFGVRYWQGKIELVRDLRANRPLKELWAPWQRLDEQLYGKNHFPIRFLYLFSLVSIPNPKPALLTTARVETERRLAVTALALSRYQHRHGRFPGRLDELVPEFVSSLPLDCMSGHRFGYQCNADGTFKLYSVGDDGIDNDGDSSPAVPGGSLGLWDGRDAVWPQPPSQLARR